MRGRRGRCLEGLGRVGRRGSCGVFWGGGFLWGEQAPCISRRTATAGMGGGKPRRSASEALVGTAFNTSSNGHRALKLDVVRVGKHMIDHKHGL